MCRKKWRKKCYHCYGQVSAMIMIRMIQVVYDHNAPVKVNPGGGRGVRHMTEVCLTIQGTLTTTILSNIILTLQMVEIQIFFNFGTGRGGGILSVEANGRVGILIQAFSVRIPQVTPLRIQIGTCIMAPSHSHIWTATSMCEILTYTGLGYMVHHYYINMRNHLICTHVNNRACDCNDRDGQFIYSMGHFPFLLIKLKFQWAILSKFNIAISVVNRPFYCSMG